MNGKAKSSHTAYILPHFLQIYKRFDEILSIL